MSYNIGDRVVYNHLPDSVFWQKSGVVISSGLSVFKHDRYLPACRVRFDDETIIIPKTGQILFEYTLIPEKINITIADLL